MGLGSGDSGRGGFQLYVKLKTVTVSKIPEGMSFESAVVLPLSISTAAAGLYLSSTLGLKIPKVSTSGLGGLGDMSRQLGAVEASGKETLLLWGGSSSMGSSVTQLAAAAGYRVITTASPANYAYCKSLGAAYVLDYHNPDVVAILSTLLAGARLVGAYDAIGTEATVRQCAAVVAAAGGGRVASVGVVPQGGDLGTGVEVVRVGVVTSEPDVVERVWGEYVPAALASGELRPAPRATVVGRGLYYLQGGLDMNKMGVSATKVVVSL